MDRVYYLVADSCPLMPKIRAAVDQELAYREAASAFARSFGTERWMKNGGQLLGLIFDGPAPAGWRQSRDYWVPDQRTKEGRSIKRQIDKLPHGFDAWTFSADLGEDFLIYDGNSIHFSGIGKFGEQIILTVPVKPGTSRATPEGCTELKMSEYWALREASDHKEAQPA